MGDGIVLIILLFVVGLVDTVTSMLGGEVRANNTVSVVDWFALFQNSRLPALGNLGLFNILPRSAGN